MVAGRSGRTTLDQFDRRQARRNKLLKYFLEHPADSAADLASTFNRAYGYVLASTGRAFANGPGRIQRMQCHQIGGTFADTFRDIARPFRQSNARCARSRADLPRCSRLVLVVSVPLVVAATILVRSRLWRSGPAWTRRPKEAETSPKCKARLSSWEESHRDRPYFGRVSCVQRFPPRSGG